MKRVFFLLILVCFYSCVFSQKSIDNFYSLIKAPNTIKYSDSWTFVKTDTEVIVTKENSKSKFTKGFIRSWGKLGTVIDSLDLIDYNKDTVFIFQWFNAVNPSQPFTMVSTDRDLIVAGYGSVKQLDKSEGWPFYYDYFHSVSISAIKSWDMDKISKMISRYGTKPGEMEEPSWIYIYRIIIENHKKIETSILSFDALSFFSLRKTNNILR
ncbi:MAG: hypothetical protein LIO77_01850 [Rikenellaceae bacterium]|nr:hypothetical protein [Rikenellaceae bacterium]